MVIGMLPIRGSNIAAGTQGWKANGCFVPGSVYSGTGFDEGISKAELAGVTLWGSYCDSDKNAAELRSPVFAAPSILELYVAGHIGRPQNPGLRLLLEREDNHEQLALPLKADPGEKWVETRWWVREDMRGKPVRLVAIDHDVAWGGWLGVSNPREFSEVSYYLTQVQTWVRTMGAYVYEFALFVVPGLAVASLCSRRKAIYTLMVVICTDAVLGYLSFWAFFYAHWAGRYLNYTAYALAVAILVTHKMRSPVRLAEGIREPLLLALLAGLCYTNFYFMFRDPFSHGSGFASERFFQEMLPGDNVIPRIFADRIYDRMPLRPFCCGGWLSSDRPPLQAGIVLMERTVNPIKNREFTYQLLGTILQCLWIPGVWCLLESLGAEKRWRRPLLGMLIFSGFLFYNSVYAWPKLSAATFLLFLLSVLFEQARQNRRLTDFEVCLGAVCLGLGLMAHPGLTLSLAVVAVFVVRMRQLFTLRHLAMAAVIVALFVLPWSAYQKYVDPPGNRLLKIHFAAVLDIDGRSTWEAVRDSYHEHAWKYLAGYKLSNLELLAGWGLRDSYGLTSPLNAERLRSAQRFYVWDAVGLANWGWLAAVYLWMRRKWSGLAAPHAGWLIAGVLVNLMVWCLVTFGPNETQTAHASYADILVLSVGLLGLVLSLPRAYFFVLFGWQVWNFFAVWVWAEPSRTAGPIEFQWPMMLAGTALAAVLVWLTVGGLRSTTLERVGTDAGQRRCN